MKRFYFFVSVMLICTLLALSGCVANNDGSNSDENKANMFHTVVDMGDNSVTIKENPSKVIITWTSGTEIAVMLNGTAQMQYCYEELQSADYGWLQYICPEIMNVPTLARSTNLNQEWVLANQPDVIVTNKKAEAESFNSIGVPAIYISLSGLDDVKKAVDIIGNILGGSAIEKSKQYIDYLNRNIELVQSKADQVSATQLKTVYLMDAQNQTGCYLTHGGNSFFGQMVIGCGGDLITKDISGQYKTITPEQLIDANPDIILCGGAKQADCVANFEELRKDGGVLSSLTGTVVRVPQGAYQFDRTSAEVALYPLWLSSILLPDIYSFDMRTEVKSFYKTFFNFDLTEKDITKMLKGDKR